MSACSALPCSASVVSIFSRIDSRVVAKLLFCANCSCCIASRVACSSLATLARRRSLVSIDDAFNRSPNLFKPSLKSSNMARCFSSSCCNITRFLSSRLLHHVCQISSNKIAKAITKITICIMGKIIPDSVRLT